MKRLMVGAALALALAGGLSAGVAAAPGNGNGAGQVKVDVCHLAYVEVDDAGVETPVYELITVGEPAVDAHLAHGDFLFADSASADDCVAPVEGEE